MDENLNMKSVDMNEIREVFKILRKTKSLSLRWLCYVKRNDISSLLYTAYKRNTHDRICIGRPMKKSLGNMEEFKINTEREDWISIVK